jgi:hypothetical protein
LIFSTFERDYEVKTWFQAFAFKCNLHRYNAADAAADSVSVNRMNHPAFGSRRGVPTLLSSAATRPEKPNNFKASGGLTHENAKDGQAAPLGRQWNRPSSARAWSGSGGGGGGGAQEGGSQTPTRRLDGGEGDGGGRVAAEEPEPFHVRLSPGRPRTMSPSSGFVAGLRLGGGGGGVNVNRAGVLSNTLGVISTPQGAAAAAAAGVAAAADRYYREAEGRLLAPRA